MASALLALPPSAELPLAEARLEAAHAAAALPAAAWAALGLAAGDLLLLSLAEEGDAAADCFVCALAAAAAARPAARAPPPALALSEAAWLALGRPAAGRGVRLHAPAFAGQPGRPPARLLACDALTLALEEEAAPGGEEELERGLQRLQLSPARPPASPATPRRAAASPASPAARARAPAARRAPPATPAPALTRAAASRRTAPGCGGRRAGRRRCWARCSRAF